MTSNRLAALIAVVALAVAGIWGVTAFLDQVQRPPEFARADLPGTVAVTLTTLGPHVVFHERDAEADPGHVLTAADARVLDPLGDAVPVRPYSGDLRYDHGVAVGVAIGVFDADQAGTYLASVRGDARIDGALAVGDDLAPGVGRALLYPGLTALGGLVLAGVVLLTGLRGGPARSDPPSSERAV